MIAPFFHACFVVPDLHEGMRAFGSTMGLTWAEPHIQSQHFLLGDETPIERTIAVTYSVQGPPHLELIEASEPPWGEESFGLHHVAFWSESVAADEAALTAQGGTVELRGVLPSDGPTGFVYVRMPHGGLIELVDHRRKPLIDSWLAGGSFH